MYSEGGHCRDPKKLLPFLLKLRNCSDELYRSRPEIKNITSLHAALKICFDKLEQQATSCPEKFSQPDLEKVRLELKVASALISQLPWMIKIIGTNPSAGIISFT